MLTDEMMNDDSDYHMICYECDLIVGLANVTLIDAIETLMTPDESCPTCGNILAIIPFINLQGERVITCICVRCNKGAIIGDADTILAMAAASAQDGEPETKS